MSEVASAKVQPLNGLKPCQVEIIGKVLRVRRYQNFTYTTIICPAPDQYSRPAVVEIRSKSRFADKEDETKCRATLGGYESKAYMATDKETGERVQLIPVNLTLDLVE